MVSGNMLRLSFSELESHVEHVAHCLYVNGLRRNDKIILQMPNVVELDSLIVASRQQNVLPSVQLLAMGKVDIETVLF